MKIVHICTFLDGGAGLCTSRIVNATRRNGVEAKILVAKGEKTDIVDVIPPPIYHWSNNWLIRKFQVLSFLTGFRPKTERLLKKIERTRLKYNVLPSFTSPATLYIDLADHPWVKEADIVHLHWVGNFLDYQSFFRKMDKPIVWTVHDQNPGLGGFHHTSMKEDEPEPVKRLDDELMRLKGKAYSEVRSLTLVGISSEMCHFFHDNPLLKRFPVIKIHNGVEPDQFKILDKQECRNALSISSEKKVFLFVSCFIYSKTKGLDKLVAALDSLNRSDILLICIGYYEHIPQASFEIRCEGYIENNNYLLSKYYSATDFYILPSIQESYSQTSVEAVACGTPIVAFPVGIIPELVTSENGIVCKDFTVESLAEGIQTVMNRSYDRETIRKDVLERFSEDKIAKQYIDLYKSLLNK